MIGAVARFIAMWVGVSFATGTLLIIYESTKTEKLPKDCERPIVVFSLIVGGLAAMASAGLIGGGWYRTFTE